jgi:hypothetical protein
VKVIDFVLCESSHALFQLHPLQRAIQRACFHFYGERPRNHTAHIEKG